MKRLAGETAILLALAIGIALSVNFFSPVGIALVGRWDTSAGTISANAKNDIILCCWLPTLSWAAL